MAGNWFRNSRAVAYTALTLIILAAVACGSASAPADTAPATEQAAVPAPDKAPATIWSPPPNRETTRIVSHLGVSPARAHGL